MLFGLGAFLAGSATILATMSATVPGVVPQAAGSAPAAAVAAGVAAPCAFSVNGAVMDSIKLMVINALANGTKRLYDMYYESFQQCLDRVETGKSFTKPI